MKQRILEGDHPLHQPHQHETPTVRHALETFLHRQRIARRIKDDFAEPVVRLCQRLDPEALGKRPSRGTRIEHTHSAARRQGELQHRQANRPRADNQHILTRLQPATLHRMGANAKRLHQRQLVERQSLRPEEPLDRHREQPAHAAIRMNAQNLQLLAAVWLANDTGMTAATTQVWLDRAAIAWLDAMIAGRQFQHLDAQFMPKDARVGKERLPASEGMQIRAAHSDTMDAHERLPGLRRWCSRRRADKFTRLLQHNATHEDLPTG